MKNMKPPVHRAAHDKGPAHRLALWRKFETAFRPTPKLSASKRGYEKRWSVLRKYQLEREPNCRHCAEHGIIVEATIVDHIISIAKRPELRLDLDNLQSLCYLCHRRKTNRYDGGFGLPRRRKPGPLL
jgi:5-methylcytosine-specific restriction endonuclease McrA